MSLTDNYTRRAPWIETNMEIVKKWTDSDFPGNTLGTCAAQVLMWCKSLEGGASGTGLKESLLSPYDKATALQFGPLENGAALARIASSTVDLRQKNSAKLIKELTPWSGKYKLYGISNNKGHGHMIGAYFPWSGPVQFYDPNLVCGTIKSTGSVYEVLSDWVDIYQGCGGLDASWGHETLFVISDPEAALKKLNAV